MLLVYMLKHFLFSAALHITNEKATKHNVKKQKSFPDVVVAVGNPYFNHLAKHLHGHQVPDIFRTLGVRDQTIFAELELYKLDRIKYEDAIYRLLLAWVRLKTTNATLAILCPILEYTGMQSLSEELLGLTENQPRNTEEELRRETIINAHALSKIPDECHTCEVEDGDLVNNGEQSDHSEVSKTRQCTLETKTNLDSSMNLTVTSFETDFIAVERETSL